MHCNIKRKALENKTQNTTFYVHKAACLNTLLRLAGRLKAAPLKIGRLKAAPIENWAAFRRQNVAGANIDANNILCCLVVLYAAYSVLFFGFCFQNFVFSGIK